MGKRIALDLVYRPNKMAASLANAPRPSKRDVSTNGKPSSEVGLQAEASHAGTGIETLAVQEGHISERRRKGRTAKASAKAPAPTAHTEPKKRGRPSTGFDRPKYLRLYTAAKRAAEKEGQTIEQLLGMSVADVIAKYGYITLAEWMERQK